MRYLTNLFGLAIILFFIMFAGCKSSDHFVEDDVKTEANQKSDTDEVKTEYEVKNLIGGVVTNELGEVLAGANILIKGTTVGTVTDIDGTFVLQSLKAFPLSLIISFVGYETQEHRVDESTDGLKVSLYPGDILDEIAVGASHDKAVEYESSPVRKSSTIRVTGDADMSRAPARSGEVKLNRTTPGRIEPGDGPPPNAGQLTASEWNDLYNWDDWKKLLDNQDYNEMQTHWQLFPRSRYSVFVRNNYELPIQDARVELLNKSGRIIWSAKTDNAGRAELWSDYKTRDKSFDMVDARVIVNNETHLIEDLKSIEEGVNHMDLNIECQSSSNVDIFFAVDATGSMGDEIRYLQSELKDVISRSLESNVNLNVRMGAVFYRDSTDEYVTRVQPLNDNPIETLKFIEAQSANGGGDYPEAVDAAISESLAQDWSEDAIARIIFLLLDAPPHHNQKTLERIQNQVTDAAKEGIKIIPITASGINRQTEFLMKFMAIATNGTYVFITDHSGIGNPHLDPVVKEYEIEKLNDLLVRLLYNYTKSNGCSPNEHVSSGIKMFPNPASEYVNISTDQPLNTIKVMSNSGKLVHTRRDVEKGETRIELKGLVDGVYTIQCTSGSVDFSQPLVIINK